jgi:protein TonB
VRRFGFLGSLAVAAVLETVLLAAILFVAPRVGVTAAPQPQRMRIALLAPPPPKPAPPEPKPKPPPPKPPPPKPPPPKPPPPKPVPAPPPPPPVPPPPPPPVPPPPRPVPRRVVHRPMPRPLHAETVRAPPPPAPPTHTAPSPAVVASLVMQYAALLNAKVQAGLAVPQIVQMMHLSGAAVVAIDVAPDGRLIGVSVARPSGVEAIDRAALAAVRSTSLPPFPAGMADHAVVFHLTVRLSGT